MAPTVFINRFLDHIRKKHTSIRIINGAFLFLTILTSGLLIASTGLFFIENPKIYFLIFLSVFFISLIYVLIQYLLYPLILGFSRERAAIWAEEKITGLNNSLINAYQLQKYLNKNDSEKSISLDFIKRLIEECQEKIQGISTKNLNQLIHKQWSFINRNIFFTLFGIILFLWFFIPNFFTVGFQKLKFSFLYKEQVALETKLLKTVSKSPIPIKGHISHIQLKFNYPAYTKMDSKIVDPSDGKINVFPGTEVRIKAKANTFLINSNLIINKKDQFVMKVDQGTNLSGSFMVNEKGFYQFGIKTKETQYNLLDPKYPILLKDDHHPRIILFLANPKPVYQETEKIQFYYEGHDDFGVQAIDLVFHVNQKTYRQRIKTLRGQETVIKNGYTWNLNKIALQPGDQIEYYLEIKDNNNIKGPNIGQSEFYSFKIFDSRQELENLSGLQDELINSMITFLSDSLLNQKVLITGRLNDLTEVKKILKHSSDKLIAVIQFIQKLNDRAQPIQRFPNSYLVFFKNLLLDLNQIRKEQIQLIKKLDSSVGHTIPVGHNFPPIKPLNQKLIEHLEKSILFLVKITNRQKMDRVLGLETQLRKLTQSIRKQLDNAQNKKIDPNISEIQAQVRKMENLLDKMIDHLSSQTQGLPDEFLNSKAFKQLKLQSFKTSLQNIMDLVNKGNTKEAITKLNEMMKDFQSLANQLDQVMNEMDEMIDMQSMQQIKDSLKDLLKLERKQKDLLRETTKINQNIHKTQLNKYKNQLKDIFEKLKKDVQLAQNILYGSEKFINQNPKIMAYEKLLDQEVKLNGKIQNLNQKIADSTTKTDISDKFFDLHKHRQKLDDTVNQKHKLNIETYEDFKNNLPDLLDKYNRLKELAEFSDIREFNSLFKNTYPMVFRWQHKIRVIPVPSIQLSKRIEEDLTNLRNINSEISKILGSMLRQLKEDYDSLISETERSKLHEMSQKQNQLGRTAQDIKQRLNKMSEKNPMIDPQIARKMSSAKSYMKMARKNLKKPDISKSIDTENEALGKIAETREMLNQLKNLNQRNFNSRSRPFPKTGTGPSPDHRKGPSTRIQKERVQLPSEDQYKSPLDFRTEILNAMRSQYPKKYEHLVSEYYRELVK